MIAGRVGMIGLLLVAALTPLAKAADEAKVLRLALPDIAYLDPQQITDLSSTRVANVIFEGLYQFDYLATPARVVPNTATAMPEISGDGRTWTIRIRPGILFASAPAFRGKPRELVAQDYVYSITRLLDPNLKRGGDPALTNLLEGARPVVDAAKKSGKLDYDAKIEGLQAIDRHALRLKLTAVDYTILERLAQLTTFAVAREAVDAAGDEVANKPVGTGPFRLAEWVRGSRVILEANPAYRALAFPASDDPALQPMIQAMKGRKLPALSRIEIAIIEEMVPELLAFDQGSLDYIGLTGSVLSRLLDNGKLKPEYARRGITHHRYAVPVLIYTYLNQDDPVVGGNAPERIALRRAIALGFDSDDFIKVFYGGQGLPANQLLPPGTSGFDPKLPQKSVYDPAAARALLNLPRFRNADYDAAFEQYLRTPDGPERVGLARKMSELVNAYVPIVMQVYPVGNAFAHPWLLGYYPSQFGFTWKYMDIDLDRKSSTRNQGPTK